MFSTLCSRLSSPLYQRSSGLGEFCAPVTHMLSMSMSRLRLTSPFCSSRSFRPRICSARAGFRSNSAGNSDIQYLTEKERQKTERAMTQNSCAWNWSRQNIRRMSIFREYSCLEFTIHLCDTTQLPYDKEHPHLNKKYALHGQMWTPQPYAFEREIGLNKFIHFKTISINREFSLRGRSHITRFGCFSTVFLLC